MVEFKDLRIKDKIRVCDYVDENITVIKNEVTVLFSSASLNLENNKILIEEGDYINTSESKLVGYWCDQCKKFIGTEIEDVVIHVMTDLEIIKKLK